jgi:hypothetical protein
MKFNRVNFIKMILVAVPAGVFQSIYHLPAWMWIFVCLVVGFIMPPIVESK